MVTAAVMMLSVVIHAVAATPSEAILRGRQMIDNGNCGAAVAVMQEAIPDAAQLQDATERRQAVSTLRFYSALANTQCGAEAAARDDLEEFFRLHPGHSKLDPAKFDRRFVALFGEVQKTIEHRSAAGFDRFYPGFSEAPAAVSASARTLMLWGASSEFQLLATQEERDHWSRLRDEVERSEFVSRFWRSRDPNADTEQNELQAEISRRVRFADRIFPSFDERGALTDRGRVFVLLGPPSRVHRQALQRGQTTFVTRSIRRPLDGQIERWIYFQPQLPGSVPAQQVEFRFITHPGYGEGIMEKDFMVLKALEQARNAVGPRSE